MLKNALSLFSSSGIGDIALDDNGIKTVISSELLGNRHMLFKNNYPDAKLFTGDIWENYNDIIDYYNKNYTTEPFIILATPPCQGMSQNGAGKLLNEFRKGNRKKLDTRNRLIIPAIKIIKALKPKWVIFENVPLMKNTYIEDEKGQLVLILDYIDKELTPLYEGNANVLNAADYLVPQTRKRLITVYTKTKNGKDYFNKFNNFIPPIETLKPKTLREAIGDEEPLEGIKGLNISKNNDLHFVPILKENHYWWIKHTKEGTSAFNNQCVNETCLYQNNLLHGTDNSSGINISNKNTPIYCEKCGSLLPRPTVKETNGTFRLMKGYTSAYKRMKWDEPASTLTQNFQYHSSDNKIHPDQNRVLSIHEALILQTINESKYSFKIEGKLVNKSLIRDTIGESVPPKLLDSVIKHIIKIEG
ncbi:DNA (cytosine-5-)-methyltransferase [Candidatus Izimaplasma bacterium ZiA1]|uniref:DNA cytosine methyltransferase n=1 Tax=Candidatus Izimoplasma sp. ZiA1 TaxID=2024899 RepID=UPI000BAA3805|nr:DNA (cytosine-5-)-methyltransferase [Candidatus Izimaplasma bacterium ZiA1]